MAYQALYRRFRPRTFADVVGQDHITTILRNQVKEGHVAHAYLFCGTRGTGKTSTAHILARALMCELPASGEACTRCHTCEQNAKGGTDIIEIDAASNNGVDEIRDLRDKVRFAPLYASHKVYIIDEVHMLTTAAFNALLKTLEEPPAHVVFILATTEPQKLPATILSRCQRYDFHRVSVELIMQRLDKVLGEVGADIAAEGLRLIALAAEGGLRDALSLADQCLAYFGNAVSGDEVREVLGSMDSSFLLQLADALIDSDAARALLLLDEVVRCGRDLPVFARDLTQHFRSLMLLGVCGEQAYALLSATREAFDALLSQARRCPLPRALRAISLLGETEARLKYAPSPRVLLDAVLVRLCRPEDEADTLAMQDRLCTLEARLNAQPPAPPPSPAMPAAPSMSKPAQATPMLKPAQTPPESAALDAPPWETPAPATSDTPQVSDAARPSEPIIAAYTVNNETVTNDQGPSAPEIFDLVLKALSKESLALYPLAKRCSHVTRDGDMLVLHFTPSNSIYMEALQKGPNAALLSRLLEQAAPGLQLRFMCDESMPAGDALSRAAAMFGEDKITIKKSLS